MKGHYLVKSIYNKEYKIHRLIANTFLPNFFNKSIVNHKDGNKLNNKLYNLEWVTQKENMMHSANILNNNCIPVEQYDFNGKLLNTFNSIQNASKNTNISWSSISENIKNINKTSGGFIWKKVN